MEVDGPDVVAVYIPNSGQETGWVYFTAVERTWQDYKEHIRKLSSNFAILCL